MWLYHLPLHSVPLYVSEGTLCTWPFERGLPSKLSVLHMWYAVTDVAQNCSEIRSEGLNTVTPNIFQVFTSLLFPAISFIISSFILRSFLHTDTHLFLLFSIFVRPSLFPHVLFLFFLFNFCVFLRKPIDYFLSWHISFLFITITYIP